MKNKIINLFGKENKAQNQDVKYSSLLDKFMNPFTLEFRDIEYIEDIYEFAVNAWNFGNMKQILPDQDFKTLMKDIKKGESVNIQLLTKMVNHKVDKFSEYSNFIVDFEIEEKDTVANLTVTSQTEEVYLSSMAENFKKEIGQEDFVQNYINRVAIILKPLQPFVDWLDALYPKENYTLENFKEPSIYLISDDIEDLESWLRKKYDKTFMLELGSFHTNKKEWPQKRNYKMFKQWFQVDVSVEVYDLENKPVSKSE